MEKQFNNQLKALQFVIFFIPILIALLILPAISLAQEDTWTRKADIPTARVFHAASVVNGKIYVIGGGSGSQYLSTIEEYDPMTDTWTKKADMPTPRSGLSTSAVNGKIYAIGSGSERLLFSVGLEYQADLDNLKISEDLRQEFENNGISLAENIAVVISSRGHLWFINDIDNKSLYGVLRDGGKLDISIWSGSVVEEYDPAMDTWTKKADMPTPRYAHASSAVGGKIYVIGGAWFRETSGVARFHPALSTVEEYDPATDTWTKKADMPTPRSDFYTSAVNGKIYAIAGGDAKTWTYPRHVEEYDLATDTWTKKADIPTPRCCFGISAVNGKIYVIGGWRLNSGLFSTVEVYDPATDTWVRKTDMPTASDQLIAVAVNGYIYAIGGVGRYTTVEAYDTGFGIRVTAISPTEGRVTGGEAMAIFGKGFPADAIVTIGRNPLTELKVTETLITGLTPPGTEGEWDVGITTPELDYSVLAGKFIYHSITNIVVAEIIPTNGKQAGGDTGSITGSGFLEGATVTIGGAEATNVVVTSTLITFTIPPGTEGAKDVVVTNPDGQKGTLHRGYTYNPFPVIEEIEPDFGGPLTGRTPLTITGSNFMEGVVVTIGNERVQRLDFFSPTELRLRTPAGTVGPKDVRVVNPDGQEAVLKEGFTYNPAPTISSVKPNMGPLEGDTKIIIIGTGFLNGIDVLIGGTETSGGSLFPSKIEIYTPPSSAGAKDVVVQNRDGQRAILEDGFTYNRAPAITKVIPDNGRLTGGTKITIQGNGFLPGVKVLIRIDARAFVLASAIQVMSPNIINAITPSGEPGPKDLVIRNPDRQEIILSGGFTYNPMPKITDVSPNHGPASGGTKIIVRGTGFLQDAKVIIGKRAATTEVLDGFTIEAVTPKNPQGTFDVRVINPDTQEAVKHRGFISVGELAYNYPNPFRAEQGTTFRYVTNERVELIKVQIFNLKGVPVGVVGQRGSNEVRWYDATVHAGLYVYRMDVTLEGGKVRTFKRALEVYK